MALPKNLSGIDKSFINFKCLSDIQSDVLKHLFILIKQKQKVEKKDVRQFHHIALIKD